MTEGTGSTSYEYKLDYIYLFHLPAIQLFYLFEMANDIVGSSNREEQCRLLFELGAIEACKHIAADSRATKRVKALTELIIDILELW